MAKTNARVTVLSTALYHLTTLALIALPVAVAYGVLAVAPDTATLAQRFPGVLLPDPLSVGHAQVAAAIGALPTLAALYVLWQMRRLFRCYRVGQTLSGDAARAILRIGVGILAVLILGVLAHSLQGLALTLGNPPGQRSLSVAVSSADLALALTGGLILVIGWVMREAVDVAEENRGFV